MWWLASKSEKKETASKEPFEARLFFRCLCNSPMLHFFKVIVIFQNETYFRIGVSFPHAGKKGVLMENFGDLPIVGSLNLRGLRYCRKAKLKAKEADQLDEQETKKETEEVAVVCTIH